MDNLETIAALAALAQATRLDTFRLLVSREPDGVPAGELARLMEVPQNTISAHLAVLAYAGLVKGERQSRSIIYRANLARFHEVALSCFSAPATLPVRSSPKASCARMEADASMPIPPEPPQRPRQFPRAENT